MKGCERLRDFYEILEVKRESTQTEIKSQYRKLAKKYHPDLNPGDEEAAEHFKEVNMAYEVLSDEKKRQMYDAYGEDGINGNAGSYGGGFGDIFGDIFDMFGQGFGGFGGYSEAEYKNRPIKGDDVRVDIIIDFKESIFGAKKDINVKRTETCKTCNGEGTAPGTHKHTCDKCNGTGKIRTTTSSPFGRFTQVSACDKCKGTGEIIDTPCPYCKGHGTRVVNKKITIDVPKGIDDKMILTLREEGDAGLNGGPAGDLYVYVRVKEDQIFKRMGNDLYLELPITYTDAVLGGIIKVPTITKLVDYDIPSGTKSGTTFRIKGEGVPYLRKDGKGDLVFKVDIHVPKKISDEERDILEELRKKEGKEIKKERETFFDKVKKFFE